MKLVQYTSVFVVFLVSILQDSIIKSHETIVEQIQKSKFQENGSENNTQSSQFVDYYLRQLVEEDQLNQQEKEKGKEAGEEKYQKKYTLDDYEFYILVVIAFGLVLFAGICSGLTVGYLGLTNLKLDIIKENGTDDEKEAAAAVKLVIEDHHLLLSTLLISNAIVMELLPIVLYYIFPDWLAILISTVAVVIIGEIIPQAYCTGKNQLYIGKSFAGFTTILKYVLYIPAKLISKTLDCMFGVHDNSRLESREDIIGLVELQQMNTNHPQNQSNADSQIGLTNDEINIMVNTLKLSENNITEIMLPYSQIYKISENEIVNQKLLKQIGKMQFSNVVVYEEGNESKVVDEETNTPIKELVKLQEPILISNKASMLELMMIFQKIKSTVALVFLSESVEVLETIRENVQDAYLDHKQRLMDSKSFRGIILGLVSLNDAFKFLIKKGQDDKSHHYTDSYLKVKFKLTNLIQNADIKSLSSSNRREITRSNPNQLQSIRRQYQ